jgi:hypothetical protein
VPSLTAPLIGSALVLVTPPVALTPVLAARPIVLALVLVTPPIALAPVLTARLVDLALNLTAPLIKPSAYFVIAPCVGPVPDIR